MSVRRVVAWGAVVVLVGCADSPTPAAAPPSPASTAAASTALTATGSTDTTDATQPTDDAPSPTDSEASTTTSAPTPSTGTNASLPTVPAVTPEGFATTTARITEVDGAVCEVCVWLADDADRRARGLMHVTDLGPAIGMAFVYPSPHTGTFWMKDTRLPLSIAFFSPDGDYVSAFDMDPCLGDPCPNYATPIDFLVALEVPRGQLDGLGIGPGSTFELLDVACA